MATDFKMPQLGETVVEGTVTRWLKKEGDTVEADEPLVEVSTDKVDSEIPSPAAGKIIKIHAQEGDTVQVGAVIAEIGDGAADGASQTEPDESAAPSDAAKEVPEEAAPDDASREQESSKQEEKVAESVTEEQEKPPAKKAGGEGKGPAKIAASDSEPRRGILSPLVRKLAQEHKIDLDSVKGSGTGGRITKQDVMAAAQAAGSKPATGKAASQEQAEPASQPTPQAPRAPGAGEEIVAVSTMRKSIAEHMVASLHETARAWNAVEIDMTPIGRLREKAGPAFKEREGYSLTWMPFICKAVSQALLKFPQVNATWNGDGTITRKMYVNLGIAVALENGLIVPVIKGAEGMNLVGLSRAVRDLAVRARSKKLLPDDVHGGTFTITNPGPFGSVLSVPIINKGQAGILAVDAVAKRPVVVTDEFGEDSIAIRQMLFISMSWDHRVIDGAEAAQFLATLKEILQEADFESDLASYLPS
ncbi:MAG TPA: 2-oxoglutarate dehydrogenase, E2 component, dihydrolipoamide succinyltransferase [Actinomycetota bacterium]|nr:2-oxoglutarate dehydrogenase, E2 component, dihydrolipoamide succinyltransferase [Actinomycetota bacterium]